MLRDGLKPILQVASDWRESLTTGGIPCGAITGLTAHMQNRFVRTKYCMPAVASRIKDIESKYYVALRFSIYRDLGTIIAANPSTILAMARLGDRAKEVLIRDLADGTLDARWDIPVEIRRQLRFRTRRRHKMAARALEKIANQSGRLLPKDYWPNLQFLSNWMGGTMRAYLRGYPEYFGETPVRDVGLIASEGRMTIPIEDGTPAGILDIRHHYFEFIPEEQAELRAAGNRRGDGADRGTKLFHPAHDGRRALSVQHLRPGPLRRLPRSGALDRVLEQRGALLKSHGRKAFGTSGDRRGRDGPALAGLRLKSYLLVPTWGDPPYYSLLVEEDDLVAPVDSVATVWPWPLNASCRARMSSMSTSAIPSVSAQSNPADS